jgi:hypothetical protein
MHEPCTPGRAWQPSAASPAVATPTEASPAVTSPAVTSPGPVSGPASPACSSSSPGQCPSWLPLLPLLAGHLRPSRHHLARCRQGSPHPAWTHRPLCVSCARLVIASVTSVWPVVASTTCC